MSMSLLSTSVAASITGVVACAALMAQPIPARYTSCATDSKFQEWVHSGVVLAVTDQTPAGMAWRDSLQVVGMPASQVALVTADSLCQRAGRLMNQHEGRPLDEPRAVALIRLGPKYWGEDQGIWSGESSLIFIMDSTLTTVLTIWGH